MTAAISQRAANVQQHATTVIPRRSSAAFVAPPRRAIGGTSRQDAMALAGAAASSLCTTMLLFGRLTPLSGRLGFVIVWFLIFLGIYAALLSLTEDRPAVVDRVMAALLTSASVLAGGALASVIIFVLWRGRTALVHSNFFTQDLSVTGPSDVAVTVHWAPVRVCSISVTDAPVAVTPVTVYDPELISIATLTGTPVPRLPN